MIGKAIGKSEPMGSSLTPLGESVDAPGPELASQSAVNAHGVPFATWAAPVQPVLSTL